MKRNPTEFPAVTVGVKPVEESLQTLLKHLRHPHPNHPSWIKVKGVCFKNCFMLPSHSPALSCLVVQGSEASSKVLGQWTGSVLLLYHIIVILCHYVHCFGSRAMNLLPSFLSHVTGRQCPVARST